MLLDTVRMAMKTPSLRVMSRALGLSPSVLSRMKSGGLDITNAATFTERYSKPRPGPKPRHDAPVLRDADTIAAIRRRMRDAATPPPTVQA